MFQIISIADNTICNTSICINLTDAIAKANNMAIAAYYELADMSVDLAIDMTIADENSMKASLTSIS